MSQSIDPQERAVTLIERARRAGADAADAVYVRDSSESVTVRLGRLEDVERSDNEHIGLRVFVGQRSATIGSSDLSDEALDELASRAIAMARAAPQDPYAGLAPQDRLLRTPPLDLDLLDAFTLSPQQLRAMAQEADEALRAVPGVTNTDGATVSSGGAVIGLATSHGFAGSYGTTSRSITAGAVAGEGSAMERDSAWRAARHLADLPEAREIGRQAGERAVARLNPARVKSGPVPILFDPRVGGSLLGHLAGAMSGAAVARRSSFLIDRLGQRLFDSGITIYDEPHQLRGLRSRPFDGEGLPTARFDLVRDGVLQGWLVDSATGRQLGLAPTGHASRGVSGAPGAGVSNLFMMAGTPSPEALMADIEEGIYVTDLIGHGVNALTGDYSRGASGRRIVKGELAEPVSGFTIAGNLLDMFAALTPADDLELWRSINVPTLRVDGMMVAGD
ncbi:MAG: TldD/PmbA family protein [Sphingomonadales bacterium]|nr:TldD/PmbA family protein [Sphingomonadales bacterium]MDE2168985.1 TldD/PmbA family protein [Sphingomonadales bacterium]